MVRSSHAHADLIGIDTENALASEGVLSVLSGADWKKDKLNPMPAWGNPKDLELTNRSGEKLFYTPLFPIVWDRVRRVGEIVAVVIAKTLSQAQEAAEKVAADYHPLPAVSNCLEALKGNAPLIWKEIPGNVSVDDEKGSEEACKNCALCRC